MIDISIQKAINFAALKHKNQVRKGTQLPYIVHPMEVMQILTYLGAFDTIIIAGILHDTLEDTDTTPEEIKEEFGENILRLVQKESEDKSKSWHERKQTTIDNLKKESADVQMICFADKLSNLRSIYRDKLDMGEKVWDRFNATKEDEYWYYKRILDETRCGLILTMESGMYCIDEYEELLKEVFEK